MTKTTISLPPALDAYAHERVRTKGFPSLSSMFQELLRERREMESQPAIRLGTTSQPIT